MESSEYHKLFDLLQGLVDKKTLSMDLGKNLVKEINRFARKEGVPVKYDPEDLELTPSKFTADVGADSEVNLYVDDSESSDF